MASRVTTLEAGHEFSLCEVSSFESGIRLKPGPPSQNYVRKCVHAGCRLLEL